MRASRPVLLRCNHHLSPTPSAVLAGNVHGVVVQANRYASLVFQLELHIDARVSDILVAAGIHGHLGFGERRGVARAVQQHSFAFVDLSLVVELLEGPPDAFHEVFVHGLVGALEIHPAADTVDGALPTGRRSATMLLAAGGDIFFEADLGTDVAAVVDAELSSR